MITAGIIGASGYTGVELYRILAKHPDVELAVITSRSYAGKKVADVYGSIAHHDDTFTDISIGEAADICDVLFLALPHGIASRQVTADIIGKCVVIDLGADFRLSSTAVYSQWYHTEHGAPELLQQAVYGLCELNRAGIAGTRLVANPGCYTTCSILTIAPLLQAGLIRPESIIVDAKSGVSGAGRGAKTGILFSECNENIKAYGVASHRHTPEIEEQLSRVSDGDVVISFTPHLVPMNRGILVTAYAELLPGVSSDDIAAAYAGRYADEPFIRLLPEGTFPETRWVKGSNYCDIGFTVDGRTGRVVMGGALDNLVKGASGQAVQNMNIVFGLEERTGIDLEPLFPA